MVPGEGLEPPRLTALDPKSSVSAISPAGLLLRKDAPIHNIPITKKEA
jgi:hypothetical protein